MPERRTFLAWASFRPACGPAGLIYVNPGMPQDSFFMFGTEVRKRASREIFVAASTTRELSCSTASFAASQWARKLFAVPERYEVLRELGRGPTGAVYAARERASGAVVALKTLDPAIPKHARPARRLRHPNIVEVLDAGEAGGIAYIAMEMIEGESLRKMLDAGPLPIARAIRIAREIASGLAHAHLEGVVHGGLKPSNIIVARDGGVKITDFGIGQSDLSPEQVRGEPIDHRCDLFALGAVLYEMLAHRPAFEGKSPKEIREKILRATPPPPSELNPHVPRALDGIVSRMLAKQPEDRLPGAPIVLRELQRLEEALGLASAPSADAVEPTASAPAAPGPGLRKVRDARGPRARAEPAAAEAFEAHDRITDSDVFDYEKAMRLMDRESGLERSHRSRFAVFAAALVVVLVLGGIGLAGFMYYTTPSERGMVVRRVQEALGTASAPSRPTAPPPVAEVTREPAPAPVPVPVPAPVVEAIKEPASPPSAPQAAPVPRASEQPAAPASAAPAQKPPRARQPVAKAPEQQKVPQQQTGGTARLVLAVSPRGEIYIDGEHHGTVPPMTTLDIEPGMHRIEVRSGARKPYLTYVTVEAGDVRHIRHDFDAKPIRPPS